MGIGMKIGIRRAKNKRVHRPPKRDVTPRAPVSSGDTPVRGMIGVVGDDVVTRRKRMNI